MPMPQFGWQPQVSWPHSRSGPWTTSAQSVKVPMNEIGNQSRIGSPMPVCVLHVVREVRQRVALRLPALVGDLLVAAGEAHRLEREEVDLPRVVERELDDAADLLVVDAVDDRDDRHDVDAGAPEVLDRAQLDVEQVADAAVRVGGIADAVELQVGVAQARLRRPRARTRDSWRTRCRWSPPAPSCSRPCARSGPRRGSTARSSARRPRTAPTSAGAA